MQKKVWRAMNVSGKDDRAGDYTPYAVAGKKKAAFKSRLFFIFGEPSQPFACASSAPMRSKRAFCSSESEA